MCKVKYNKLSIDLLSKFFFVYTYIDNTKNPQKKIINEEKRIKKKKKYKLTFLPFVINCRKNHTTSNLPSDLKCIRLFIPMFVYFVLPSCIFLCSANTITNATTPPPYYIIVFTIVSGCQFTTLLLCFHVLCPTEQTLLGCFK